MIVKTVGEMRYAVANTLLSYNQQGTLQPPPTAPCTLAYLCPLAWLTQAP